MLKILFVICLFPAFASAQQGVEIVKDHRLDLLIKKQAELNKKVFLENNRTGPGFRVLVISTSDRQVAMDVKSRLMRDFPDHKTYMIYQSPHFKVQIGNFKTRPEAEAMQKRIAKIYPEGVIVIPSVIEMKPEEDISRIVPASSH